MHVRLEEVCERGSSNLAQKDIFRDSGKYPVYGASGKIGNVDFYQQEFPYVAVVKDGAGIGRTMLLPAKSSVIGTMQYLLPKKNIMTEYLYYVVRYMHLEKYFSGATIPHIYFRDYKYEKFNLVSIEKQTIVCKILKKVERVIESRKDQLELLDKLTKSRFMEMFGGINDSRKFTYFPLKQIAKITSGGTPKRDVKEYWENGDIPWVKTTELQNCFIRDTEEHITTLGMQNSSAKIVPLGTILIAMYGQGKTRGKTGYLMQECATNQACACIIPSEKINSIYLWKYLVFSYDFIRSLAKGGNQPNLNVNIIGNISILLPPIELQKQFADFVKETDKSRKIALIFDRYSKFLDTIHI